jgi:hypothetical protein
MFTCQNCGIATTPPCWKAWLWSSEGHLPIAVSPRRLTAGAVRIGPRRLLKSHPQQPVRIGQHELAGLVEFCERLGVAAFLVEHLAEHGVAGDRIDPAGLGRLDRPLHFTAQGPLRLAVVAGVDGAGRGVIAGAGNLLARLRPAVAGRQQHQHHGGDRREPD